MKHSVGAVFGKKYAPGLLLSVLLIFSGGQNWLKAQNTLSEAAEISVLTCEPGDELYSAFGHTAFRVKDSLTRTDLVFNYGTFDFRTPNFYTKFAQGKLDYMLSISQFEPYVRSYVREKRGIREQVLNLTHEQKNEIYFYLMNNARPENKFYRYDFLFDNCASRIPLVLGETLGESIHFGDPELGERTTFRLMLLHYLQNKDWTRFGINILIGLPADKNASNKEAGFLPDFLESSLSNSTVKTHKGEIPLVKNTKVIYSPEDKAATHLPLSPGTVFWSIFLIAILLSIYEKMRDIRILIFDRLWLFMFGLAGMLMFTMWFFSDHDAVINNLNIIWAFPLHLAVAFLIGKNKRKTFVKYYFIIYSVVISIFLLFYFLKIDFFDPAILPIILLICLRSWLIFLKSAIKS